MFASGCFTTFFFIDRQLKESKKKIEQKIKINGVKSAAGILLREIQ